MAKASRFAYTTFAAEDSLYLEVSEPESSGEGESSEGGEGTKFKVSQVTTSFPINGIPQATVMIAIGRDARDPSARAEVHENSEILRRMNVAKIFGEFKGQYRPDQDWPAAPDGGFLLFDGYLSGFTYRKLNGKVYATVHINHWLVDLTMSSSLSSQIHPRSSSDLRSYAVQPGSTAEGAGTGGTAPSSFVSGYRWYADLQGKVPDDLWEAIKFLLTELAGLELLSSEFTADAELAGIEINTNDRAITALERIEGPEYDYGSAIKLSNVEQPLIDTVAKVLGDQAVDAIKHNTIWDLLVGVLLPMFGLELWPQIDKAVIAPSLPAYRDSEWRVIEPNEFISVDNNASIQKPVRGVMVYGGIGADTMAFGTDNPSADSNGLAGFAGHGEDGSIILISPPPWLASIPAPLELAGETTGVNENGTINTATQAPDEEGEEEAAADEDTLETMTDIMHRFADMVYVQSVLRGRTGTITGRLRYDIAPGSHIKVNGSPEKFLGGEDELGGAIFAQVNRVTVSINADGTSPSASTSFGLSYVRTEDENEDDATSLEQPPYYEEDSMVQGLPLLKELETDAKDE